MKHPLLLLFSLGTIVLLSCQTNPIKNNPSKPIVTTPTTTEKNIPPAPRKIIPEFDRSKSKNKLTAKIKNKDALVVHVMVPLCDNDNQGIVKVNKQLGDGLNLRTNLYWGSKYGIKNHFKVLKDWQFISAQKDISADILERVIYQKKYSNNTTVYLVADAYRGDRMKACVQDYLMAIAGHKKELIAIASTTKIGIHSQADLVVFNGHNGLMDVEVPLQNNQDQQQREAAIIACASHNFFKDYLKAANAYPLITTTNLLAPEAYVLEALINSWAQQKEGIEIRKAIGLAYHQYQKCGVKGATRLFSTGW